MHDPAKFQQETIKAITGLQTLLAQVLSRHLALQAVTRALVTNLSLPELQAAIEEFDAEVDHLASQLPPQYQQPKYWQEWSTVLEAAQTRLAQKQATRGPGG